MKKKIFSVFLVIVFLVLGILYYTSKYSLMVSHYTIESDEITKNIRIVQISDLHNSVFGKENQRLIDEVKNQNPDLIFITGDILNSNQEDTEIAYHVIEVLSQEYPVYFSYGNHEKDYEKKYQVDVKQLFQKAGAIVLEQDYVDTEVNGQNLRIGGIYGYCLPEKYSEGNEDRFIEKMYLSEYQDTDRYKILLCHMPVCWLINGSLDSWNVNAVFAGHAHGGQIIFPLIGGLYGPDMGFFPGRIEGVYDSEDGKKHAIVSRGLGSTEIVPRINNIPEIVVVDIQ